MVTGTKIVKVHLGDGTIKNVEVRWISGPPWRLKLSGLRLAKTEFSGINLFEAQIALRLELEKIGAFLLCAGSRIDAFPSGMSRDMGGGRIACITRMSTPTTEQDLVDIFDDADLSAVGSVEAQKKFHESWGKSLCR